MGTVTMSSFWGCKGCSFIGGQNTAAALERQMSVSVNTGSGHWSAVGQFGARGTSRVPGAGRRDGSLERSKF